MDPLQPLIANLHADGRPRIWSLVITVFGDCVQHRGGRVATARLSRLLGRIGVETGALRTALSRLSRDGWVEGRKSGRTSSYVLTERGLDAFVSASARIYAAPPAMPVRAWVFDSPPVPGALAAAGGSLRPAPVSDAADGFRITGEIAAQSAPAVWAALPPAHETALHRLGEDLIAQELVSDVPLDAAAARMLLVHRWRRLILRWPDVPAEFLPDDFRPRDLHRAMASAYARLSPAAEAWLDMAEGEMPSMPDPAAEFGARFGLSQNA